MYESSDTDRSSPEPAQKLLYHATGKLYRYLAGFAGEDPDEVERAFHDSFGEITAGADPVLIGDAIGHGIGLGISLAERRRALQRYHDELVRRELAPPAYDTELIESEDGDVTGLRVLVSEPDSQFFTTTVGEPELLVRTPDGGEVTIQLEFDPGSVERVDSGESVSEVIVRPDDWSSLEGGTDDADSRPEPNEENNQDFDDVETEFLDAAREVVIDEPERALSAAEAGGSDTLRLAGQLIERKPSVPFEEAPDLIHEAIQCIGLDALEDQYDAQVSNDTEDDSETPGEDEEGDDE